MSKSGFSALRASATIASLLVKAMQDPEDTICEIIDEYINTEKGKSGLGMIARKLGERWKCSKIDIDTKDNLVILKLYDVNKESANLLANDIESLNDVINGTFSGDNPIFKDEFLLASIAFVNSVLKRKADPKLLNDMLRTVKIIYNKIEGNIVVEVPVTEKILNKIREVKIDSGIEVKEENNLGGEIK